MDFINPIFPLHQYIDLRFINTFGFPCAEGAKAYKRRENRVNKCNTNPFVWFGLYRHFLDSYNPRDEAALKEIIVIKSKVDTLTAISGLICIYATRIALRLQWSFERHLLSEDPPHFPSG